MKGNARGWAIVAAALATACSAIVGLTDVPGSPEGGAPDGSVDGAADGANDSGHDAMKRPPFDGGGDSPRGCQMARDCDAGQACNPATGRCGVRCGADMTCNGGCCNGSTCQAGTDASACGHDGFTCEACTTMKPVCTNGSCGCMHATDCPVGQACYEGACGTKCSGFSPCNAGCCVESKGGFGTGTCVSGTEDTACGTNGGGCFDCMEGCSYSTCVVKDGGGVCGCTLSATCTCSATKTCALDSGIAGMCM